MKNIKSAVYALLPIGTLLVASPSSAGVLWAYMEQGNTPDGSTYTDCNMPSGNNLVQVISDGFDSNGNLLCSPATIQSGTGSSQNNDCGSTAFNHQTALFSGNRVRCVAPTKSAGWDTNFNTGDNATYCVKFLNVRLNGTGSCISQLPFDAHSIGTN
jgi:hypothetical protein